MPLRLRLDRTDSALDEARLRETLEAAAAAPDTDERRRCALLLLRDALKHGRSIARERLTAGAGGIETARLLACVTDAVVVALYDFTTTHIFPFRNPTEGERLALMAVGGYGRGALAPFSDLDLLFLRPYKTNAQVENVIEYMLYALWDLGFKVGHASRTVDECVRFARDDFTIRTSLLEARRLAGDEPMSAELKRRFRKEVVQGTGAQFVAAKLAERDLRHERAGASRYMVEPNVKEGKGGLRDLNTLFWIAQYLHPSDQPAEIVQLEAFTGREVKAFIRAFEFLWAVRCFMHFVTGRAEERLSFDLQPEIARCMGYGGEDETASVERFMRRYFLIAREVGTLTRTFCAQLEAEHAKRPVGLSRFLPLQRSPKRRMLEPGFHEEGRRLDVDGPETFERDPVNLLRLFQLADRYDLDLHPDAFSAVTRSLNLIGAKLRRDPEAARVFLDVLAHARRTQRTLTLMNESGVLGRYVPEFGRIVAQMQFNMYHAYTVDEHTLRAVGVIAEIAAGRLRHEHPLAVSVFPLVVDRQALFLSMLLHDIGKGGQPGGQEIAGARNARQVCERLGLSPERVDLVAWVVQHHLAMSDFAQKRDLSDPRTISAFARLVADPERLRLLLIVTVSDIRAVGPGVWNAWKGQLIRQLYSETEALFRGGRSSELAAEYVESSRRSEASRAREQLIAPPGEEEALKAWVGSMEDAYFVAFPAKVQLIHFQLARQAAQRRGAAALTSLLFDGNAAEVVVAANDRKGLFADLAGALAHAGANVVGARVFTSALGQALDIFYVQDRMGQPFGREDPGALERLTRSLEAAGRGEPAPVAARRPELGRAAAFPVAPGVALDNEASDAATVVEVSGRDRPGVLEAVARTLAGAGLSVQSAHVESYGERAVDAFYVITEDGGKLQDPARIDSLKAALTAAMLEAEPDPQKVRARVAART